MWRKFSIIQRSTRTFGCLLSVCFDNLKVSVRTDVALVEQFERDFIEELNEQYTRSNNNCQRSGSAGQPNRNYGAEPANQHAICRTAGINAASNRQRSDSQFRA